VSLPGLLVLDWGIGGFGVVRLLSERAPGLSLCYFSDAGFPPYGKVPAERLAERLGAVLAHFAARGVRRAVIACNAASTAVPALSLPAQMEITEVIGPGVDLVRESKCAVVGLVGGVRTVRAGAHRRRLGPLGVRVVSRVAQPLSALIEAGELDSPRVVAEVARIVAPLKKLPALLLACTHYPAIAEVFAKALPGVTLLDPAARAVEEVLRVVPNDGAGRLQVFTSGDIDATRRAARLAFGVETGAVTRLSLDG
jgi:glutamate racemase